MIYIYKDNGQGLGNKIKKLVSALYLASIENDAVVMEEHIPYVTFTNDNPIKPEIHKFNAANLQIYGDRSNILNDFNRYLNAIAQNTFVLDPIGLDFEYNNIKQNVIDAYLHYFDKLIIDSDIIEFVGRYSCDNNLTACVGICIRSWIETPRLHWTFDMNMWIDTISKLYDTNKNIFVCADSLEIIEKLKSHFPNILYLSTAHKNRHEFLVDDKNEFLKEALTEMLILSKCESLIVSYGSSFPECAWWFGRGKQSVVMLVPPQIKSIKEYIKKTEQYQLNVNENIQFRLN